MQSCAPCNRTQEEAVRFGLGKMTSLETQKLLRLQNVKRVYFLEYTIDKKDKTMLNFSGLAVFNLFGFVLEV